MENKKIIQLTDNRRMWIFICLVVSGIASSTLSTAMATAQPNLTQYFGISTATGQWVTNGMNVAFLWMAVGSMILWLISILGVRKKEAKSPVSSQNMVMGRASLLS